VPLGADRPVVLDVRTDPEVPPLPPHITFDQAVSFAEAVVHGDPNRGRMIRESLRQAAHGLVPGR
jgi:pyruvate dehydrogenase (quinone)